MAAFDKGEWIKTNTFMDMAIRFPRVVTSPISNLWKVCLEYCMMPEARIIKPLLHYGIIQIFKMDNCITWNH